MCVYQCPAKVHWSCSVYMGNWQPIVVFVVVRRGTGEYFYTRLLAEAKRWAFYIMYNITRTHTREILPSWFSTDENASTRASCRIKYTYTYMYIVCALSPGHNEKTNKSYYSHVYSICIYIYVHFRCTVTGGVGHRIHTDTVDTSGRVYVYIYIYILIKYNIFIS